MADFHPVFFKRWSSQQSLCRTGKGGGIIVLERLLPLLSEQDANFNCWRGSSLIP